MSIASLCISFFACVSLTARAACVLASCSLCSTLSGSSSLARHAICFSRSSFICWSLSKFHFFFLSFGARFGCGDFLHFENIIHELRLCCEVFVRGCLAREDY